MTTLLPIIIWTIVPLSICVFLFRLVIKNNKLKKIIQNTPTSKMAFLKNGVVEICGHIQSQENMLQDPMGNKPCVYYNFTLEESVPGRKHKHWKTQIKDEKFIPFTIHDDTGSTIIDMKGAKTYFAKDCSFQSRSSFSNHIPDNIYHLIKQKYAFDMKATFLGKTFNREIRYALTCLCPDDQIYVLGTAKKTINGITVYQDKNIPLIVADKSEEFALHEITTGNWIMIAIITFVLIFASFGFYHILTTRH